MRASCQQYKPYLYPHASSALTVSKLCSGLPTTPGMVCTCVKPPAASKAELACEFVRQPSFHVTARATKEVIVCRTGLGFFARRSPGNQCMSTTYSPATVCLCTRLCGLVLPHSSTPTLLVFMAITIIIIIITSNTLYLCAQAMCRRVHVLPSPIYSVCAVL